MRTTALTLLLLLASCVCSYPQMMQLNDRLYLLGEQETQLNLSKPVFHYHELIPLSKDPIHLGDEVKPSFSQPNPKRSKEIAYHIYFTSLPEKIILSYDAYDVDYDKNEIKVNDFFSNYVCTTKKNYEKTCKASLKPTHFKVGANTLIFKTTKYFGKDGYDDYMISHINLKVNYSQQKPQLVPIKAVHPQKPYQGQNIVVSISLLNIGVKPAYNITLRDTTLTSKQNKTVLLPYSEQLKALSGLNHYRRQYNLTLNEVGEVSLPQGEVFYFDDSGELHSSIIGKTTFTVLPSTPKIRVTLNQTKTSEVKHNISLTLVNGGTTKAYDLDVQTTLPYCVSLISGNLNLTLNELDVDDVKTVNAQVSVEPSCEAMFSSNLKYKDELGQTFWSASNYIKFAQEEKNPRSFLSEQTLILVLIILIVLAAALYAFYLRVA